MLKTELDALAAGISAGLKGAMDKIRTGIRKGAYDMGGKDGMVEDEEYSGPTNIHAHRILVAKSADCKPEELEFRKWNDDCMILGHLLRHRDEPVASRIRVLKRYQQGLNLYKQRTELAKAMTTGGAGTGAEWIPTGMSSEIIEFYRLEAKVMNFFNRRVTIPRGVGSIDVPRITAVTSIEAKTEGGNATGGQPTTGKINLSLVTLVGYIAYSDEMEEDTAVSLLPEIKKEIGLALKDSEEDGVINGDTTGLHMDSDVTAASDPRKKWMGLRKRALQYSYKVDLSTFNYDNLLALKKKMKRFGTQPSQLVIITNYAVENRLHSLKDSAGASVWLSRRLPNDPWVDGVVGYAMGIPVVISDKSRDDLNASGVYDGSVTTKSGLIIANHQSWLVGEKGGLKMETDRQVKALSTDLVGSIRRDFKDRQPIATCPIVAFGYNIAT
jgi:HK97 family phage major capsid protein